MKFSQRQGGIFEEAEEFFQAFVEGGVIQEVGAVRAGSGDLGRDAVVITFAEDGVDDLAGLQGVLDFIPGVGRAVDARAADQHQAVAGIDGGADFVVEGGSTGG